MELFVGGCIFILTVCIIDALRPRGYGPQYPIMGSGHGGTQPQPPPVQPTQPPPVQSTQPHFPNQPNQGGYGRQVRGNGSEMMVWVILALLIIGTLVVLMPGL